jgi:hypothetical protein
VSVVRLPLVLAGTNHELADLLRNWAAAYRRSFVVISDDELTAVGQEMSCFLRLIADHPASSYADIAAKLSICAFQLNGAGTFDEFGITDDNDLVVRQWGAVEVHAEAILMACARDVLRLNILHRAMKI